MSKLNVIFEYFKDLKIELPTPVQNALTDVFEEKTITEDVELYHLNHKNDFINDIAVTRKISVFPDKPAEIFIDNRFTYYGDIKQYAMNEKTYLYAGNKLVDTVADYEESLSIFDETDYVILVKEFTTIKDGKFHTVPTLMIYCPVEIGD